MTEPIEANRKNWYSRWLLLVWLVGPVITAVLVLTQKTLPNVFKGNLTWCLVLLDILHLMHVITDFYSVSCLWFILSVAKWILIFSQPILRVLLDDRTWYRPNGFVVHNYY